MKALVTGGAGFIGSSLCEALIAAGWEARAFDNFTVGSRKNISPLLHGTGKSRFDIVSGDCTRPAQI
ncbi:MAG TPA: NAD-dependent epimerase/dehydratase family protein, partial [Candidatus Limnocylindrales bacterium]|nr:NAD-dependent epimerase/dehydratase family protein [Candidatus Limnocylindrales bacterium]HXL50452.1 NAD-dependent epimerase/dehydratase family protein [Candidatus Limnocylindrales bacterium]